MKTYIDAQTIQQVIDCFKGKEYIKPEQIGLFFYFKAAGINSFGFSEYKKWGEFSQSERENYMRTLYDLSGVFDCIEENGLKYTALFPFSIASHYKTTSYYNGGSVFKVLGSRISDTLDNSLVSTIIQRDSEDKNLIKFNADYLTYLKEKRLKGQFIPLRKLAAWCFKYWLIELPDSVSSQDYADIITLSFLLNFNITAEEYRSLFVLDAFEMRYSEHKISGKAIREALNVNKGDCVPEITETQESDYLTKYKQLTLIESQELLKLRGDALTDQRIIEILEERDKELKKKMDQTSKLEIGNTMTRYTFVTTNGGAQNRVVYGTPGCGKSYYVQNTYLRKVGVSKEHRIRTTFYMDYTNTDFVGQILPKVKPNGEVTYIFNPGPFALALRMSIEHPNSAVALIIEELNRGNAASIFGDIFQLLDRDESGKSQYEITSVNLQDYLNQCFEGVYTFDSISIPANLHIVATMNTSDQNVFTLDTAFKRRWQFEKIRNEFSEKHEYKGYYVPGMSGVTWQTLCTAINKFIVDRSDDLASEDKQLGVYFIDKGSLCENNDDTFDEIKIERFAFKLFEYLWDDVAKYAHSDWFAAEIKTLDDLIDAYKKLGVKVFADGVLDV